MQVRTNQSNGILSWEHLVSTMLHLIQISLAYILMLIVMTFNTWLCLAVVIGSTLGYFLIGWKRPPGIDVSDHCHWLELNNHDNSDIQTNITSFCKVFPNIDIVCSKRDIKWYLSFFQRKIRRTVSHTMRAVLSVHKLLLRWVT